MTGGVRMDGIQLGLVDSLVMSLSGMAIVFFVLILLAIAIILMGKILDSMGLGSSAQAKKAEESKKSAKPVSSVSTVATCNTCCSKWAYKDSYWKSKDNFNKQKIVFCDRMVHNRT